MVRDSSKLSGRRVAYLALAVTGGISLFFTLGLLARACAWSGFPIYSLVSCYAEFEIANNSGIPISVTPVGIIKTQARRVTLPVLRPKGQRIWTRRRTEIPLAPGQTIRLAYDFDEIQFSEVLVHTQEGGTRMLLVIPSGVHEGQYSPPRENSFSVPALAGLPAAPDNVKGYDDRERRRSWYLLCLGILAPLGWWIAQRGLRSAASG